MFGFGKKKDQDHIRTLAQDDGIIILFYSDKGNKTIVHNHMLENSRAAKEMFGEDFTVDKWKANKKFDQVFLDEIFEIIKNKTATIHIKNKLSYTYTSKGISKKNPCWITSSDFSVGKDIIRAKTELNTFVKQKNDYLDSLESKKHIDKELMNMFTDNINHLEGILTGLEKIFVDDLRSYYTYLRQIDKEKSRNTNNEITLEFFNDMMTV